MPSTPPPSRRIADELGSAIRIGELRPGEQLPSERSLAEQYGVARGTVQQAFSILQAEGLVVAEHGRGVFVRRLRPVRRLSHDRYARRHVEARTGPFEAEMAQQGRQGHIEVLGIEPVPAPAFVAERLGIHEGARVLRRRNRYYAEDEPVHMNTTYVRWEIAEGTDLQDEVPGGGGGLYVALAELGHSIGELDEDVTARMPSPEEARTLVIPPGVPVLEIFHVTSDQDGLPVEMTHWVLPADRNILGFKLPTS